MRNVSLRRGLLYFRRKVAGKDTYIRLPALDSPDFAAEYARLSAPSSERQRPAAGTFAALIPAHRKSPEFQAKDIKTRTNQGRYLDMISLEHGHRTVRGVRPVHVYRMRDAFSKTPGKANNWLSVFKGLMKTAMRLDMRSDNPAAEVSILPIGEHEPWPADLLRVCLEEATPMTRLAIVSGICSGQRIGDVIRMQYGWINEGFMEFSQQKKRRNGFTKDVAVPIHSFWTDELAKLPRRAVTLLYDRTGTPFKSTSAIQERLRALMASPAVQEVIADLIARETIAAGTTFSFHGLRKNACCYLLECGLNDSEVGEILGMSPEIVRHYGKRARALMIAQGAAARMTGGNIIAIMGATCPPTKSKK